MADLAILADDYRRNNSSGDVDDLQTLVQSAILLPFEGPVITFDKILESPSQSSQLMINPFTRASPLYAFWLPPLYTTSALDKSLIWQVGFDGVNKVYTIHGHLNGAIQTDSDWILEGIGGRTLQQQAIQIARRKYADKYRIGYVQDLIAETPCKKPMKGNVFDIDKKQIKRWPVAVQAKIDGIRMVTKCHTTQKIETYSALNTRWHHLTHVVEELAVLASFLPAGVTLDGELYVHGWAFTKLTSVIKAVVNVHPDISSVKYHIFDVITADVTADTVLMVPYECRYNMLLTAYKDYIEAGYTNNTFHIVSCELCQNMEEIVETYQHYLREGYEGLMVKKIMYPHETQVALKEASYHEGRCSNILKLKKWNEEEGTIIGVEECRGREEGLAKFLVRLDQPETELESGGKNENRAQVEDQIVAMRPEGDFTQRMNWLQHPEKVIGKRITFSFMGRSEYGIPRHPVGKAIRDYE
jgi:ATP-dependent DNA ligase